MSKLWSEMTPYERSLDRDRILRKLKRKEMKEQEKPFYCEACEKASFRTQEELSRHQHYFCIGGW